MRRIAMGAMALAGLSAFAQADHTHVDECLNTITAAKDYFAPEAATPVLDARKFKLEYFGAYKVLTNVAGKRQYILYPCGAQAPAEADLADVPLPASFQRKALPVPAQKVVTAETVSYDFLAQLDNGVNDMGVTDRVLALSDYTTNACAQKALTCAAADNRLGANLAPKAPGWGSQPADYQAYMDAIQVYFDSGDGKKDVTGDKSVIFSATSETSLLGRGEWIKFAAAFFNLEHVADKKFEETKAAYLKLSAKAKAQEKVPKVAVLDIDTWASQDNDMFSFSLAGFERSAVLDAGGYIPSVEDFAGTGATFPANMRSAQFAVPKLPKAPAEPTPQLLADREAAIAKFLKQLEDVDVVIDKRYAPGVLTLEQALAAFGLKPEDKAYPFIAKAKWYRQDKTGSAMGTAWFETGVSRPDLVLKDFVKVIHPELDEIQGHQRLFLRDVFANEEKLVIKPEDCQSNFPICDKSLEHYPDAPICPANSFKACADDSKVFLSPASGCTKFETCSLQTYANKVSDALPVSTSITIAVFMAFVALVLLAVGYAVGKKKGAKKTAGQAVSPDARFAQGAQLH